VSFFKIIFDAEFVFETEAKAVSPAPPLVRMVPSISNGARVDFDREEGAGEKMLLGGTSCGADRRHLRRVKSKSGLFPAVH